MFTQISTGELKKPSLRPRVAKGEEEAAETSAAALFEWRLESVKEGREKQRRAFAAALAAASAALKALHHRPERGLGHTHTLTLFKDRAMSRENGIHSFSRLVRPLWNPLKFWSLESRTIITLLITLRIK